MLIFVMFHRQQKSLFLDMLSSLSQFVLLQPYLLKLHVQSLQLFLLGSTNKTQ